MGAVLDRVCERTTGNDGLGESALRCHVDVGFLIWCKSEGFVEGLALRVAHAGGAVLA